MMHWESSNELNAFRLLDCDPNVTSYSEQPCQIVYIRNGVGKVVHHPDILVTTAGRKQFWESLNHGPKPLSRRVLREQHSYFARFPRGVTHTK